MRTVNCKISKWQGFTLLEVLIALTIGIIVATVFTLLVSSGFARLRASRRLERVQANMGYVAETFSYWVKQGLLLQTPSPQELRVIVPTATSSRTIVFQKTGMRVTMDGAALTTDDIEVTNVNFRNFQRSVRFNITARSKADPSITLSATSTTARRNEF